MPSLPPMRGNVNLAPHVVILGAGASRAATPRGDRNGVILPLMNDLISQLDLGPMLAEHGLSKNGDFEAIYSDLSSNRKLRELQRRLEERVFSHFGRVEIPEEVTVYDRLLLGLREKDVIASFNWDPMLMQAYVRNQGVARLPKVLFLHGNVAIATCNKCRRFDLIGRNCGLCGRALASLQLLYPIRKKDYSREGYISAAWNEACDAIKSAYMLTIFGYGAPASDVDAVNMFLDAWSRNSMKELAEIEIVDVRGRRKLEASWKRFFVRNHYAVHRSFHSSWICDFPRRSCDAFAAANLENDPWSRHEPMPRMRTLSKLQSWIRGLSDEEDRVARTGGCYSST